MLAEAKAAEAEAAHDPLEAYMSANTAQVRAGRVSELRARITTLTTEEARLRRLIQLVQPAMKPTTAAPAVPAAVGTTAAGTVAAGGAAKGGAPAAQPGSKRAMGASGGGVGGGMAAALHAMRKSGGAEASAATTAAAAAAEGGADVTDVTAAAEETADGSAAKKPKFGATADLASMSAADRFKAEYMAAVGRLGTGEERAEPMAGAGARSEGGQEPPKTQGLGFGAALPDAARLQQVLLPCPMPIGVTGMPLRSYYMAVTRLLHGGYAARLQQVRREPSWPLPYPTPSRG